MKGNVNRKPIMAHWKTKMNRKRKERKDEERKKEEIMRGAGAPGISATANFFCEPRMNHSWACMLRLRTVDIPLQWPAPAISDRLLSIIFLLH